MQYTFFVFFFKLSLLPFPPFVSLSGTRAKRSRQKKCGAASGRAKGRFSRVSLWLPVPPASFFPVAQQPERSRLVDQKALLAVRQRATTIAVNGRGRRAVVSHRSPFQFISLSFSKNVNTKSQAASRPPRRRASLPGVLDCVFLFFFCIFHETKKKKEKRARACQWRRLGTLRFLSLFLSLYLPTLADGGQRRKQV